MGQSSKARKNLAGWLVNEQGQVVVPPVVMREMAQIKHRECHWGAEALMALLKKSVASVKMMGIIKAITMKCEICLKYNPINRKKPLLGHLRLGTEPGDYWQIDFSELPKSGGYWHLLVLVDTFSGWPEAFPCRTDQAREVVKRLLQEIIPRFGVPLGMSSDRGPHFIAGIVQEASKALGIQWDLHMPWRPQSSGKVERMNQSIKRQIGKKCQESNLKWPQAVAVKG